MRHLGVLVLTMMEERALTDFEKSVLTGLATLQAEMRQVLEASKLAAQGIREHDRRVTSLEDEIRGLREDLEEQGRHIAALQSQVGELMEIRQRAEWSARTLRVLWSLLSALIGGAMVWFGKDGGK